LSVKHTFDFKLIVVACNFYIHNNLIKKN
jgi:hypothetical protein